jgi:ABC-type transport system involved in cytochrome bd biosynthesis fused ATPase/permease subunit
MNWIFTTHLQRLQPVQVLGAHSVSLWPIGRIEDFSLPAFGLIALVGSSGSGKTTLLRALAGVDEPIMGTIGLAKPGTAKEVHWVGVDTLLEGTNLRRAIDCGCGADRRVRALEVLGLVHDPLLAEGLGTELSEGGNELSGGQRLRLAIARALAGHGSVLCDEPTAKLDSENAERVRQALRSTAKDRLVIVATHDPALIEAADQVISLTGNFAQCLEKAA